MALLLAAPARAAEIFVYVDDAGVVHARDVRDDQRAQRWAPGELDALLLRQRAVPHAGLSPVVLPRSARYDDVIARASTRHGVPFHLVKAVIAIESGFRPQALSRAGARGLMQLMPNTARDLGVNDPHDPQQAIDAGTRYLAKLLKAFRDETLALAAYNAGPARVARAGRVPDIAETKAYVASVRRVAAGYAREDTPRIADSRSAEIE
jgi:soluble lytic murein transglycosylase-like protein